MATVLVLVSWENGERSELFRVAVAADDPGRVVGAWRVGDGADEPLPGEVAGGGVLEGLLRRTLPGGAT